MRKIRIEAATCLWWAVLLMILPLRWILASFTAGLLHEFCHYLAIRAAGGDVTKITLRPFGAIMEITPLSPCRELFCAMAGPVGGLIPLLFVRFAPITAMCAFIQTLFNLLPIFPLDGGRALKNAVQILLPSRKAEMICRRIEAACIFLLLASSFVTVWQLSLDFSILIPLLIPAIRFIPGKRPCKTGSLALQ